MIIEKGVYLKLSNIFIIS